MSNPKKSSPARDEKTPVIAGLDSTVGSFASRIKRKLQEQAEIDSESVRAQEARHALMLNAMTNIRKALQETCKIDLGERFSFGLEVDDWDGWPRVELQLKDALTPGKVEHALVITANDRKALGTVSIDTRTGKHLGQVRLCDPDEFPRIQLILKKALRGFLDTVGSYVLNPKRPSEIVEVQAKPLETGSFDALGEKLSREDVFSEEGNYSPNQNTVSETDPPTAIDSMLPPLK